MIPGFCLRRAAAFAVLLIAFARPALALHRESPPATRLTSTGVHTLSPGRQSSTNALAFVSDQDLLGNGSTGQQVFVYSLLFFDCNNLTTRPGTPCPSPPRPALAQITFGGGNPSNPSLSFREDRAFIAFEADGSFVGLTGAAATHRQIFMMNLISGELVTVTRAADGDSTRPSLAGNGAVVAFESTAQLTASPQPVGVKQVYAFKRRWPLGSSALTQITRLANGAVDSLEPSIDKNGVDVAFTSRANLLGDGSNTGIAQIFESHLNWNTTSSETFKLTAGNADSVHPYTADNHGYVIFESLATNFPGTTGTPGSAIFTAPFTDATLPALRQVTDPASFGDSHDPTLSFTDQRAAFICTGDPLHNGTTGNRAFVFSLPGLRQPDAGTLRQVTGRGDVQAASL